jgi:hypothetical protein
MRQEMTEDDLRDSLSMYEDLVSNIPVGVYRFRMKAALEVLTEELDRLLWTEG